MTWPNSLTSARTLPGNPLNFPRGPANDNFRPVTRPWRPTVAPANDNFLRRPRLGGLKGLIRFGPLGLALTAAQIATQYYMRDQGEELVLGPNWIWVSKCDPALPVTNLAATSGTLGCSHQLYQIPLEKNILERLPNTVNMYASNQNYGDVDTNGNPWTTRVGFLARTGGQQPIPYFRPLRSAAPLGLPFAPPASPIRVGKYQAPYPIYPEWSDHGPRTVRQQHDKGLTSTPPPSRTKERKVRVRSHAVGRAIEFAISQATESLDMLHAVFEALPMWLKMKYINAARWREHKYNSGRIIGARLRYRALTPQEKVKILYDHYDLVDTLKATTNILASRGSDRAWAKIGQQMGAFQRGPWDSSGREYMDEALTELDEFDPYFPDLERVPSVHARAILEQHTKMEYDEYRRLYDRLSSYQPRG